MSQLWKQLRMLRVIHGYSQEYMAQQLNITQSAYSKIERNEVKIDTDKVDSIAEIFGIQPGDLFEDGFEVNFGKETTSFKVSL